MANEEEVRILKQGVEVWNKWRSENPNTIIDLCRADLKEAKLQQVNLAGNELRVNVLVRSRLREANLSNANLDHANLRGADLTGANLSKAYLTGAILSESNLTGANISGAHLRRSDLSSANLVAADLVDANLREANLRGCTIREAKLNGCNLLGADLREADLVYADFRGADLTEAILNRAIVGYTIFGNVDLSKVKGLEEILHHSSSTLATDTIQLSQGKIPTVFLRGCGLSDLEIEFAKLATPGLDPEQVTQITYAIHDLYVGKGIQYHSCFISYNNKDQAFAQRLHDDLQDHGVRCWFAPEDLKTGDVFRKTIGEQIRVREKLLVIISKNSIKSEWVGDEVEKALKEEKEQNCLKLFPIRLDNSVFKSNDDWSEKVQLRRHIGDFSSWKDETKYKKAFERLLNDLKASGNPD